MRTRLNRAPWHDATRRVPTITGPTDASPQAWGGLIRRPFGTVSLFRAAADVLAERYNAHINVKETFALHEVLKPATTTHPSYLKESTAVNDVDNKAMHDACKKERSRNAQTHDLIEKFLWHQLEVDLTLELCWVCSEENCLTRPEHAEHAQLSLTAFDRLYKTWGRFDIDLMAIDAPTQLLLD